MSQTSKNVSTDITSSPFQLPADIERGITNHPGLIDYFKEYTGVWRHGVIPGFTVILYAQDGSGRTEYIEDVSGEIPLPPNPFGETEKVFAGWSYKVGGEIITTPTILVETNMALFANWRAREQYHLTYDAMGGTGAPPAQEKEEKIPIIISSIIPVLKENTFLGWSTTPIDQVVEYQPGDSYNLDGDTTLYAVWRHDTYKITFFSNGGTGTMPAVTGIYGTYYLPECKFKAPKGKTFAGWAYGSTSSPIQSRDIFIVSNTKLYAIWVTGDYVVSYDVEGGSPSIPYQTKKKGIDLKLSTVIPTRVGYTFLGWCGDDSGTPHFQPGDMYTLDASVSLIAVWKPDGFLITYDANGGTGAPAVQTKKPEIPLTLSDKMPIRTGFLFLGWATYPQGPAVYQPGDIYTKDESITLYAAWKEIIVNVFYDANGGSGTMEPSKAKAGIFTLPECTFTPPPESVLLGWGETPDATVTVKNIEIVDRDRTVYAIWRSQTTYTITYDANGGTGAPESQKKVKGIPINLSMKVPTYEHQTFLGWGVSKAGPVVYQPGAVYGKDENLMLYAIWEVEKFTLTFNSNGGSGEDKMPPIKIPYGKNTIPGSKFTPPVDNRFAGWSESPSDINLVDEIFMDKDKTVYAIWTDKDSFLVTYDLNGAPKSEEDKYPPQYKKYLYALKIPERIPNYSEDKFINDGYLFLGWEDNNGKRYNAGSYYKKEMDTAMTAQWHELLHYPVIFLPNGGDGYMEPLDTFGNVTLPDCQFEAPPGTEFIGWALTPYDDLLPDVIYIASKVSLYAIYE